MNSVSASGLSQDGTGMYIRQIDKNAIQIQSSKDNQKQDLTKIQSTAQNVQMITVPQGMTVLQNPLNISQMPTMIGQPNSQVYMIPANHPNLVQGTLPSGLIGQQMLQPGQNVTVMQPNQLTVPGGVQYNVPLMPMNVPGNHQFMQTGINLNAQLSTQQLNAALAGHQLNPNLAVSGTIPIVQAPPHSSPMANPTQIPVSQSTVHQMVPQNSFMAQTTQYGGMPQQYVMQSSGAITVPTNNTSLQYSIPNQNNTSNNGTGQATVVENDAATANSQANYLTSQDNGYSMTGAVQNSQQTYSSDNATAQPTFANGNGNGTTASSYGTTNGNQNTAYVTQATTQPPPNYPTNGSNPQTQTQNYGSTATATSQNTSQPSFSPSSTPAPNQSYPTPSLPNMPNIGFPQNPQNPYPNATGQNLAAYASNQYPYTSRPWFRPRYGSPQGSPYSSGTGPPPSGSPMPVPPPSGNFNYWQDS